MAITIKTFKPTSHTGSDTSIQNITSTYDGNEDTGTTVSAGMLSPAVFIYTIPITISPSSSKRKLELEVIADNDKSDVQIEVFNPTDNKSIDTVTCGGGAAGSKKKYIFDITGRFDGQTGLRITPTVMARKKITVYEVSLVVTSEDEGVRKIFLGSNKVKSVKLGATNVSKVYVGNALVFMFQKLIDYSSTDYSSFTYGSGFVPI